MHTARELVERSRSIAWVVAGDAHRPAAGRGAETSCADACPPHRARDRTSSMKRRAAQQEELFGCAVSSLAGKTLVTSEDRAGGDARGRSPARSSARVSRSRGATAAAIQAHDSRHGGGTPPGGAPSLASRGPELWTRPCPAAGRRRRWHRKPARGVAASGTRGGVDSVERLLVGGWRTEASTSRCPTRRPPALCHLLVEHLTRMRRATGSGLEGHPLVKL